MKSALIVLPACLLALAHLISAQITGVPPIDCEQVRNLSPECQAAFSRGAAGADAAAAFCSGDCFRTVLSAYQSCGSAGDAIVQGLQQGCARNSNGDLCYSIPFSSTFSQALTTCSLGSIGDGNQCSDDCRTALEGFGCCANSLLLGTSTFVSACGLSTENCPPATGGASGIHSIVGILTSLIFAGFALMFKY